MEKKVKWEEMFPDEIRTAIEKRPVCYLAYGLSEPHGLQNALGLDGLKAYALAQEAAKKHGGVVAPMTWWHVHETPFGLKWLSTQNIGDRTFLTNVPLRVFLETVVYQLRAVENAGFRAAVLVTGHYGGIEYDIKLTASIYSKNRPLRTSAMADYEIIRYKDYRGDHAGICETSQLWALRPELTDISRVPAEKYDGAVFASPSIARHASRREGEKITDSQIRSLKKISDNLLGQATKQPKSSWIPFESADKIWKQVLALRKRWLCEHTSPDNHFKQAAWLYKNVPKLPL